MIDWDKSAKLNKMSEGDLKARFDRFPKSAKKIVSICDNCDEEREVCFYAYHDLCNKCSVSDPESRKKISDRAIERCANPEYRKQMSERSLEQWSDPIVRDAMSEIKRNSDPTKKNARKQIGGNDLCCHHIAYDFKDSEALIVRITRKFHSSIHHPKGIQLTERGYSLID